jgi:aminoglycoside phosphotransferase (APT) family kinase protein
VGGTHEEEPVGGTHEEGPVGPTHEEEPVGPTHEGVDRAAVTDWLAARVERIDPPLVFELVTGGRSNLTFTVRDRAGRSWVLRRPPLHSVLPSAHDMGREHTVMSALGPTPVPVPRTIGYEPDADIIGAEFYVMEHVEGTVVRDLETAQRALDEQQRRRASEHLVDVLVGLHQVEPDAVGLADFGRKEGYIERQLGRWHGQLQKGAEREVPVLDEVHERLSAAVPEQGPATIVHGDYRLDNVILADDASVRAVLDWELCTLGDPLADVGLLAVYWSDPGDEMIPLLSAPTTAEGFLRRGEVVARYGERSGRDLGELDYYVAFAYWKLAIILEGVYTRYTKGAYGDVDDADVAAFADLVIRLGERAERAATAVGR